MRLNLFFFELDVLVEHGFAVFAFGDDVEADAADVLLRAELLRAVHLFALDLQLQTSPLPQLDDVASVGLFSLTILYFIFLGLMLVLSEFHASKVNVTCMLSCKNHARGF